MEGEAEVVVVPSMVVASMVVIRRWSCVAVQQRSDAASISKIRSPIVDGMLAVRCQCAPVAQRMHNKDQLRSRRML